MNILRLNAYFDPEITAASHLMDDLYEGFSKNHIKCKIITPEPTRGISREVRKQYKAKKKEKLFDNYIEVERFSMINEGSNPIQRALRYVLCSAFHYFKGIQQKDIDVVFSGSTPPINGVISALVAKKLSKKYKRKVKFVYELQDIFPDSLVNAKLTNEGSFIWKIGRKIEQYTYLNADKIIVPAESMKNNIMNKGVQKEKIDVISNWIDIENVKPIAKNENILLQKLNLSMQDFIVVYAGNFGEAQGADIILKVAKKLEKYSDIKFVVFGGGAYYSTVKKQAEKMKNIIINNLLSSEFVSNVYSLGDVDLITCKKGTGMAGMPSKTWSIMACNTPIIASFDCKSDLADVIKKSNAGICVEPENVEKLTDGIMTFYNNRNNLECNSRQYVYENASRNECVRKYIDVIKESVNVE